MTDKLEQLRKEYATLSSEREIMMEKVDANNRIMSEMDEKVKNIPLIVDYCFSLDCRSQETNGN